MSHQNTGFEPVELVGGFFAYPSNPPATKEVARVIAEKLSASGVVSIVTWEQLAVGGHLLWDRISEGIEASQLFICDLSGLNKNVLFELGYAIARRKRVWIVYNGYKHINGLDISKSALLRDIGHIKYNNDEEVVKHFFAEQPYTTLTEDLYSEIFNQKGSDPKLLYLKSAVATQASKYLTETIEASGVKFFTDDPLESPSQPLSFYAPILLSASAVVVHFLPDDALDRIFHNQKCAFLAGMSFGLGKPLLMLGEEPFVTPMDYSSLLRTHDTAEKCRRIAVEWLESRKQEIQNFKLAKQQHMLDIKGQEELRSINLGTHVAENERDSLDDYFVETSAYSHSLQANNALFVGRRGAGKTANFIRIHKKLKENKDFLVIEIFPSDYEFEGILRVLRKGIDLSEQGFLVESLWKFLLYTEIARGIHDEIVDKPSYIPRTEEEDKFMAYVTLNEDIILSPFSVRLDKAINRLEELNESEGASEQKVKISELLHTNLLAKLRRALPPLLAKKDKVIILFDNLDKGWTSNVNTEHLSLLLSGLLSVRPNITKDFENIRTHNSKVNLALTIFLRSDVFDHLLSRQVENDKVDFTNLNWTDRGLLTRIVEERFYRSSRNIANSNGIWYKYFASEVKSTPTKAYLANAVLPRPRDIIYLSKVALSTAIDRGHSRIEEDDLITAEQRYSKYAVDALINENVALYPNLDSFLYELIGESSVLSFGEIAEIAEKAQIPPSRINAFIEHLTDQWFFGLETSRGNLDYLYIHADQRRIKAKAMKYISRNRGRMRYYQINTVFRNELEIR